MNLKDMFTGLSAPNKKLLIGIDMRAGAIRVMRSERGRAPAGADRLDFTSRVFTNEFYEEFKKLLSDYVSEHPDSRGMAAYVVLPDDCVGFETFNLPAMSQFKLGAAIDAELNNLYVNMQKTHKVNKCVLKKGRDYNVYGAYYFDKNIVSELNKAIAAARLFPRVTTYSGNALCDGVFGIMPRARGKSFLIADVRRDCTNIAVSVHGKTLGTATIPHGSDLLREDEVQSEYMITDHELGEIAVINAREIARAKSLTVAIDDDEVERELSGMETAEEESGDINEGAEGAGDNTAEESAQGDELTITDDEGWSEEELTPEEAAAAADDGEEDDDDGWTEEEVSPEELEGASSAKVYKKTPRRYPKYMQRPVPDTEEGVVYENFRIILKWLLLYARNVGFTEYAHAPDYILVNIPREFYPLITKANAEEGNRVRLVPLTAADKASAAVKDDLWLAGAAFADKYNRDGNY